MTVMVRFGDILDTPGDTLVLPVDGQAPGLEGNVARKFMARVGAEHMHELYAPPPNYPFNGRAHWSSSLPCDRTHFRWICCLGVLSHAPNANHRGYVRAALGQMLAHAGKEPGKGEDIACPVLTGGHRIRYIDAVYLMLSAIQDTRSRSTIHITEHDPERFEMLQSIVGF